MPITLGKWLPSSFRNSSACTTPVDIIWESARNAPLTLRSAKATVDQLVRPDVERDLAMLDKLITDCFNSQDYQEGVKAFSEKRRPQFQGR